MDFLTDHIFAFSNARGGSIASATIGWSMIFNLFLGPVLSSELLKIEIKYKLTLTLAVGRIEDLRR